MVKSYRSGGYFNARVNPLRLAFPSVNLQGLSLSYYDFTKMDNQICFIYSNVILDTTLGIFVDMFQSSTILADHAKTLLKMEDEKDILLHITCLRRDGYQTIFTGSRIVALVQTRERGYQDTVYGKQYIRRLFFVFGS